MKIRGGWVSNSSSTSFCVYGAYFSVDTLRPEVKAKLLEKFNEDREADDRVEDIDVLDSWDVSFLLESMTLIPDGMGVFGYEHDCMGMGPENIGDDETGRQFKDRVEKAMKELFDQELSFGWQEECYYD
jgi:hypothetical protein